MVDNNQQHERDEHRLQVNREELLERTKYSLQSDGYKQIIKGLHVFRQSKPLRLIHSVTKPILCITVQGSKEMALGDSRYVYDVSNYLLTTIELPSVGRILEASQEQPYISLMMDLPAELVGTVLIENGHLMSPGMGSTPSAIDVSPLHVDLLDAVVRLVRLQDSPERSEALLPLVQREIIYYLLLGNQADRLSYLLSPAGYTANITKAIFEIRDNLDKAMNVEALAQESGMSLSSFHQHFKAITSLSPVQFQKQLRLQAARQLMLSGDFDAATAAFRVGYNDPSHFGRDYKTYFGESPVRDIQRLREEFFENSA